LNLRTPTGPAPRSGIPGKVPSLRGKTGISGKAGFTGSARALRLAHPPSGWMIPSPPGCGAGPGWARPGGDLGEPYRNKSYDVKESRIAKKMGHDRIMDKEKKQIKTIRMREGDYGEHQIEKVDRYLRAGYSVIIIEEDENGKEVNRYEFL